MIYKLDDLYVSIDISNHIIKKVFSLRDTLNKSIVSEFVSAITSDNTPEVLDTDAMILYTEAFLLNNEFETDISMVPFEKPTSRIIVKEVGFFWDIIYGNKKYTTSIFKWIDFIKDSKDRCNKCGRKFDNVDSNNYTCYNCSTYES